MGWRGPGAGAAHSQPLPTSSTHLHKLLGMHWLDVHGLLIALHGRRLVALRPQSARPRLVFLAAALPAALLVSLRRLGGAAAVCLAKLASRGQQQATQQRTQPSAVFDAGSTAATTFAQPGMHLQRCRTLLGRRPPSNTTTGRTPAASSSSTRPMQYCTCRSVGSPSTSSRAQLYEPRCSRQYASMATAG